jgi:carbohydrate diacid regulator
MILSQDMADRIVTKTMEATQLNINVMDRNGIIISSSDPARIHTFHEGAFQVISSGREIVISSEESLVLQGSKPGINLPIWFHDQIVGVIGISGRPDEVIHFGKAVKIMTETMLEKASLEHQLVAEQRSKDYLLQEMVSGSIQDVAGSKYLTGLSKSSFLMCAGIAGSFLRSFLRTVLLPQ